MLVFPAWPGLGPTSPQDSRLVEYSLHNCFHLRRARLDLLSPRHSGPWTRQEKRPSLRGIRRTTQATGFRQIMIEDALSSANPLRRQCTARIQRQAGLVPTSRDLACSPSPRPVVAGNGVEDGLVRQNWRCTHGPSASAPSARRVAALEIDFP